jgi:iron(III) transport system ATP-binding protein
MQLEVRGVSITYGGPDVVRDVSIGLAEGAIGCLLGPSGCGKTTLLRAIAGFEPVRAGTIALGGVEVARPGHALPPEARRVGMVFQDLALFPHLTTAGNIAFGLRTRDKAARAARVAELLALIGLPEAGPRYPHELSGGQQQRVALARAMAPRPALLLLDEPFASLDQEIRESLAREVGRILKEQGMTALLVTHDQREAFAVADEIGVMSGGRIEQWGTGDALYGRPATPFVARFIGEGALLPGTLQADGRVATELGLLAVVAVGEEGLRPGAAVEVLVRPEDLGFTEAAAPVAEVVRRDFRGADALYTLRLASGSEVQVRAPGGATQAVGERVTLRPSGRRHVAFPDRLRVPLVEHLPKASWSR